MSATCPVCQRHGSACAYCLVLCGAKGPVCVDACHIADVEREQMIRESEIARIKKAMR